MEIWQLESGVRRVWNEKDRIFISVSASQLEFQITASCLHFNNSHNCLTQIIKLCNVGSSGHVLCFTRTYRSGRMMANVVKRCNVVFVMIRANLLCWCEHMIQQLTCITRTITPSTECPTPYRTRNFFNP